MRMWLDTEFNEFGGALISLALAAENGEVWYETLPCPRPGAWVAEHVIPVLGKPPEYQSEFKRKLSAFLCQYPAVHIVADWPDDIRYFCEAVITGPGTRVKLPSLTFELRFDLPDTASVSALPHNALADAIALRDCMLGKE